MVALGLSALLVASATAFTVLKVVGAGYLLWLAVDALRHGSSFSLDGAARVRGGIGAAYLKGIAINLLNPKVIVFFITFLPQFVSPSDPDAVAKLFVLGVLFVAVATPISLAMIFGAGSIAQLPEALAAGDAGGGLPVRHRPRRLRGQADRRPRRLTRAAIGLTPRRRCPNRRLPPRWRRHGRPGAGRAPSRPWRQ